MSKTGLGRGLGALIPAKNKSIQIKEVPAVPATLQDVKNAILQIPLDRIQQNPDQPRKNFDHDQLEDLVSSIKEHGILQPLVVTPANAMKKYTIIAGERRYRASQVAGLKSVPAIIRDVKEQEQLELALVENIQRADLNPMEEARAYQRLVGEFNLTQEEAAKRLGKSRSSVANALRMLELPIDAQAAVEDGKISPGHAKILASLERHSEQSAYLERILKHQLTVRELEEQTKTARKPRQGKATAAQQYDPIREAQEELLRERFGTKTLIKKSGDKGQIIIHFYSQEELNRLLKELS